MPSKMAEFLSGHPAVARAFYPGLAGHPQHALAARQMSGDGSIVSFEARRAARSVRSAPRTGWR